MKGISEIITMVLIILIVVSLIGMLYVWISGMFTDIASSARNKAGDTDAWAADFEVISARNVTQSTVTVIVRNTGNSEISVVRMNAYVNGDMYLMTGRTADTILAGDAAAFNITGIESPHGKTLKVVEENGLEKTTTIT